MFDDVVYKDKFIWQRSKNEINIREHEISFETASLAFDDPLAVVVYDLAHSRYDEDRYRLTGFLTYRPSFVTVCFTTRAELTRIFSARKADEKEKYEYIENARQYCG
jgi:uncharacterized protein